METIIVIIISFVETIVISILPCQIKKRYDFENYSEFFIGIKYLLKSFCCSLLFILHMSIPFIKKVIDFLLDDKNILDDIFKLSFELRMYIWMVHLLMGITKCYLFYKSISTIESMKNYDLIWMFISGVIFKYLLVSFI